MHIIPQSLSIYGRIGIVLDTGNSGVVPTITVSDADVTSKKEHEQHDDAPAPVGSMPAGVAPAIPDWYRVGWRQVGGIDAEPLTVGEAKDLSVLQMFLGEQFYGEWYWNAALIVFVSLIRFYHLYLSEVLFRPSLRRISLLALDLVGGGCLFSLQYATHTIPPP